MNTVNIPEQGQIVTVRQRRFVVTDVLPSTLPPSPLSPQTDPQHLLTLNSIEDDALGETLQVVWELEPGARVSEKVDLPEPTGFDPPERLDAFLDAVRWGAVASADVRALHVEMDQAVAAAYGWDPLAGFAKHPERSEWTGQAIDLDHGFYEAPQGLRYTISQAARWEVLDRLLALNHERYAEEVRQGVHGKKKKSKGGKRASRRKKKTDDKQPRLF